MRDESFLGSVHQEDAYVEEGETSSTEDSNYSRPRERRRGKTKALSRFTQRLREKRFRTVTPTHSTEAPAPAEYCSRSEEVCAELLRRFIPNFRVQPGVTFQVPIGHDSHGNTLAVDFLVDGVLVEYHPVRFHKNKRRCGDFRDHGEYQQYTKVFYSLKQERRAFFHSAMERQLADNYFRRRREMLDHHPLFRRTELIVVSSPEELYYKVIKRFGANYPSVQRFEKMFKDLQYALSKPRNASNS